MDEGCFTNQVFGSKRLSLFADDEAVPDSQLAEQLPPACDVTICCHVALTEEDPVTAWNQTEAHKEVASSVLDGPLNKIKNAPMNFYIFFL